MFVIDEEEYIQHYGILRRSGRWPWGSRNNVPGRAEGVLEYIRNMEDEGLSPKDIAKALGEYSGTNFSTTDLKAIRTIALNEKRASDISLVERLKAKGMSNVAIANRVGVSEGTVRAYLKPGAKQNSDKLQSTVDMLVRQVEDKGFVDVGKGNERYLGISEERMRVALAMVRELGYTVDSVKTPQVGRDHETTTQVLASKGTTQRDIFLNREKIKPLMEFSDDGGGTYTKIQPPKSINPSRVAVRYGGEGGEKADGVIFVRPGVEDVSLGGKTYAQVRIKVGDKHYLKGMAVYSDDLPDGVDLLFNTNKLKTPNKLDAMKELENDPDLPFGTIISKQITKRDPKTGEEVVSSSMNLLYETGDWEGWSDSLASQVLSKQKPSLARQQLNLTYQDRKNDLDEIKSLTNNTVKQKLLYEYADNTDSSAVHLKAAAMPRQGWHVILPSDTLKDNEIYAPNYKEGERVALIRYPHGGIFEIPELIVTHKDKKSRAMLGDTPDAVAINHRVAERLSGADFDGDTVLVIPNNNNRIKTMPALEGLKNFDPQREYPAYEGMSRMTPSQKQMEMGKVSNLITDMTIKGASHSELARAVRHSMVVIDAEKHNLNYKESYRANGISALKEKYQGAKNAGASTIISRAKSEVRIPEREPRPQARGGPIDPKTGKLVFEETGRSYIDSRTGKTVPRKTKVDRLAVADDAHTLSSGTPIEKIYADHSNRLKSLANEARRLAVNTPNSKYSKTAARVYSKEVKELNAAVAALEMNSPKERAANIAASQVISAKKKANPVLKTRDGRGDLKKIQVSALEQARARLGARRETINITDKQWEAIQAGAISHSKLKSILLGADSDRVRKLATPRTKTLMNDTKTKRAKMMLEGGYTRAEVAAALGVSVSTLDKALYS